jgi:solute carrier family 25 phosphate transporter 23/24/25/41
MDVYNTMVSTSERIFAHTLLTSADKEFRSFVQETEHELLALFKSIDHNNDGKISRSELKAAFSRAGLAVPNSKLDNFFLEVDTNRDGVITFDEWR